jgi:hypothetical protein
LFFRKIMEACEAKELGHDSKQRHQVEGPIMQAKEWMREFGWCNPWSTRSQSHKAKMNVLEENQAREGTRPPGPVGPSWPASPLFKHPRCSPSVGKLLIQLSVRVLKFVVLNHLRLSHM